MKRRLTGVCPFSRSKSHVVFLFIFFKNFFIILFEFFKTRAEFVNKRNVAVFEIASTWLSDIRQSYKLVKDCRHRNFQFNWGSGDVINYPSQCSQCVVLVEAQRVKPLEGLTTSFIKPLTLTQIVSTFLRKKQGKPLASGLCNSATGRLIRQHQNAKMIFGQNLPERSKIDKVNITMKFCMFKLI